MPIYEYVCPTCGVFEAMQKVFDPALTVCPNGHEGAEKKISAAGFILKGSGWYVTDYGRKGANGASAPNGEAKAAGDGKGSSDGAAKPAASDTKASGGARPASDAKRAAAGSGT